MKKEDREEFSVEKKIIFYHSRHYGTSAFCSACVLFQEFFLPLKFHFCFALKTQN